MVQFILEPDLRSLLPPLLACLPTACVSQRPPPALLPLLTPILRQRVQLLSANSPPSESWLSLLCWSSDKASLLRKIVESDRFELHPVSGEVEFKDVDPVKYKKLDEETLHARAVLGELGVVVIYLWCVGDVEGGGDGWRVAEVSATDETTGLGDWQVSITAAGEARVSATANILRGNGNGTLPHRIAHEELPDDESDDDDAYWRQYDDSPAPQLRPEKPSPSPRAVRETNEHRRTASEEEYFAQYAQVQLTLDNDDPSFKNGGYTQPEPRSISRYEVGKSVHDKDLDIPEQISAQFSPSAGRNLGEHMFGHDQGNSADLSRMTKNTAMSSLSHPRPSSSSSSGSSVVARLEETVASGVWAEIGVKQHLSVSIKSLFRVARTAGIGVGAFGRLLRGELDGSVILEESSRRGPHQYISSSFYGLLRPARIAGIDDAEIERVVSTELAVLEIMDNEDAGVAAASD